MAEPELEIPADRDLARASSKGGLLAPVGAVLAALLGSLCCIGPLLFVTFGVGAGLASTFDPLRPLFGILMAGGLGIGFYTVYGRKPKAIDAEGACCTSGAPCAVPRRRARDQVILWSATILALLFWTFPTWSTLFV